MTTTPSAGILAGVMAAVSAVADHFADRQGHGHIKSRLVRWAAMMAGTVTDIFVEDIQTRDGTYYRVYRQTDEGQLVFWFDRYEDSFYASHA